MAQMLNYNDKQYETYDQPIPHTHPSSSKYRQHQSSPNTHTTTAHNFNTDNDACSHTHHNSKKTPCRSGFIVLIRIFYTQSINQLGRGSDPLSSSIQFHLLYSRLQKWCKTFTREATQIIYATFATDCRVSEEVLLVDGVYGGVKLAAARETWLRYLDADRRDGFALFFMLHCSFSIVFWCLYWSYEVGTWVRRRSGRRAEGAADAV